MRLAGLLISLTLFGIARAEWGAARAPEMGCDEKILLAARPLAAARLHQPDAWDLVLLAGFTLAFNDRLRITDDDARMGYELDLVSPESFREPMRRLMDELIEADDGPELGAFFVEGPRGHRDVRFRGEGRYRVEGATVREAYQIAREAADAVGGRAVLPDGEGLVIHALHTHPPDASSPHSARDILAAIHIQRQVALDFGPGARFLSHVLPRRLGGRLVFTFDPRRHRVF